MRQAAARPPVAQLPGGRQPPGYPGRASAQGLPGDGNGFALRLQNHYGAALSQNPNPKKEA